MSIGPRNPQGSSNPKPNTANKHSGNKGKGGGGGKLRYGAMGGYGGVSRKKAAGFVNADIRDLKRDTKSDTHVENRQYKREKGDIRHVYGESGQELRRLRGNTDSAYSHATDQSAAAQQALAAQLQQQSGAIQGSANGELARLGIGGSDATAQMGADALNSQHVAAQNGANVQDNLGMAQANSHSLANMMIASNTGQRMSDMGQARNVRDENVAQLRDALHQAQAGRGDSVRALLDQMAQTGWAQHMSQAQLALQAQALKKTGSSYGYGTGYSGFGSGASYSPSSYQKTYGYGYSNGSGTPRSYSGSNGGSSANGVKQSLYGNLLNTIP